MLAGRSSAGELHLSGGKKKKGGGIASRVRNDKEVLPTLQKGTHPRHKRRSKHDRRFWLYTKIKRVIINRVEKVGR